ncbi:hypothetical protein [Mycolicibacterium gilvum]|uniref:ABC transporter substrate-binding protein n=1 Tax=Mycolicibacterium gilvum TaxID=1804 RepID=A0A378SQB5_9MYCO|nr:hypothetical protein [Mycolicibacterium gilvum]MCV7054508.1 hypothetical protein [Mycolicibacterium gilvum]STZ44913.1 Uncharacterised protein [Mycolicibacterium gilvum]
MSRLTRPLIVLLSTALVALVGFLTGNVASAQPPQSPSSQKSVAVTGTDLDTGQQVFTGTFTANSAQADESAPKGIALVGELTGQLMPPQAQGPKPGQGPGAPGNPGIGNVKQEVAMPVADITFPQSSTAPSAWSSDGPQEQVRFASQQASCSVLNLTLGPLDLNLLGLRVQLNQVDLVITAIPSDGLLGQLLCALAGPQGILSGILQNIINLLNQILGQL